MSENSGPKGQGNSANKAKVPAQATKAQASETKQQATVEKKYTAPAVNKGESSKAASDAVLAAAQKVPVRDAHTPLPAPYVYPGFYAQTPPSVVGGGSTVDKNKNKDGDELSKAVVLTPMDPPPEPVVSITPSPVRTPTRNVTKISDLVPQFSPEHIAKILFENVSAVELSIRERHDTIEGINQRYSLVSNLSEIRKKYDAAKQLSIMDKLKPLTSIYTINIQDKIPQEDYLILQDLIPKKGYTTLEGLRSTYQYLDENNLLVTREKGYYYIDTNGDLVIELINLETNQEVEVYIDTNGTIYKVES